MQLTGRFLRSRCTSMHDHLPLIWPDSPAYQVTELLSYIHRCSDRGCTQIELLASRYRCIASPEQSNSLRFPPRSFWSAGFPDCRMRTARRLNAENFNNPKTPLVIPITAFVIPIMRFSGDFLHLDLHQSQPWCVGRNHCRIFKKSSGSCQASRCQFRPKAPAFELGSHPVANR